eukprot:COSAG02_NODE_5238_length_4513_cov_5.055279_1_plen_470_part_00
MAVCARARRERIARRIAAPRSTHACARVASSKSSSSSRGAGDVLHIDQTPKEPALAPSERTGPSIRPDVFTAGGVTEATTLGGRPCSMTEVVSDAIVMVVSPLDDVSEKKLVEDSNAVECPQYWTVKFAAAVLRPRCIVPVLRIVGIVAAVNHVVGGVSFADNPLGFLQNVFLATTPVILTTNPIGIRRALVDHAGSSSASLAGDGQDSSAFEAEDTRSEEDGSGPRGTLFMLGYGRTLISKRNKKRLDWGAIKILPILAFFLMMGIVSLLSAVLLQGQESKLTGRVFTPAYAVQTLMYATATLFYGGTLLAMTFHAMKCASVLVGDSVIEVIHNIRALDPKDREWKQKVVEPTLLLATETFPNLSVGFGPIVGLSSVGCWFPAIGFLCAYLEHHALGSAICLVGFAFLPVLLAGDMAEASSLCDTLRQELNKKRLENLDCHDELYRLEFALDRLNECEITPQRTVVVV